MAGDSQKLCRIKSDDIEDEQVLIDRIFQYSFACPGTTSSRLGVRYSTPQPQLT